VLYPTCKALDANVVVLYDLTPLNLVTHYDEQKATDKISLSGCRNTLRMCGHPLLRPLLCHGPNRYSATKALTLALSIDTGAFSQYCRSRPWHSFPVHGIQEEISTSAGRPLVERGTSTTRRHAVPWRPLPRRQNHDADVIVGDLRATLEAHRATNMASIIRNVASTDESPRDFKRPTIHYGSDDTRGAESMEKEPRHGFDGIGRKAKIQHRPVSVRQRRLSIMNADQQMLSLGEERVRDYEERYFRPVGHWCPVDRTLEGTGLPWLDHLDGESGDGLSR